MCRCTCAMLIFLVVCFTANPTATVQPPPQPPSVVSEIVNQRVELTTACVITLEKQCVFKMNGLNSRALYDSSVPISNTSGILFKPECSSDGPLRSCCHQSVKYLQNVLQPYQDAYTNLEARLTALQRQNITDIKCQGAVAQLHDVRDKLLIAHECSQVICKSRELCEFIKCEPQQPCDPTTTITISITATTKPTTTSTTTTPKPTTTLTTTIRNTTTTSTTIPNTTSTTAIPKPTTSTTSTTRTSRSSSTTTTTTTTSNADDNGQSPTISTTLTSTSSNMTSSDVFSAKQGSSNVAAIILGVVVSLLVAIGVAVFLIFWWRRRRAKKGGKTHGSPSTIAFVTEAETGESQYSELSNSVGCRQTADKKTNEAQPNRDNKFDHEYSVIPADVVKFTHPNDLDHGYDVLIDVTKRKLPPAPAQDGEYSLARNPDGEMKKKLPVSSGLKPAGHSLTKTTAIQDLTGKNNAEAERKEKQGQYFVLEKDEDDFDNAEKKDGQYFILEENADGDKQSETGGQYFVVEKENADEKPEIGGKYFVLEKESADEKPETGGQYFVLEKDAASGNDKRENGGQYFVLEKEDADENSETGGQYFVLEKDSSDTSGQDQTVDNKVYSSLNRDNMEPVDAAEQASEYTALDNFRAGTTSPGSQSSVVP